MPAVTPDLIGPAAALVLALGILFLFYTGRILPRNTVPREDYEALRDINASYPEAIDKVAELIKALALSLERVATNGKPKEGP